MNTRSTLPILPVVALLSFALAACSFIGAGAPSAGPAGSPPVGPTASPPVEPTPTPIAAEVDTAQDAASVVIASDPRFEGATQLRPDVIGASKWWEAQALDDGAFQVQLTIGWGDCPAGCINHHSWVYRVAADGELTLLGESGDPLPEN